MTKLFYLFAFLLVSGDLCALELQGLGVGSETGIYQASGARLLQQFYFSFNDGSHDIRKIQVDPFLDYLTLNYSDDRNDDEYFYKVAHLDYPTDRPVRSVSDYCHTSCSKNLIKPPVGDYVFALVGFELGYTRDIDRPVNRVSIREVNGILYVDFFDRTGGEEFFVNVRYVYLPISDIANQGIIYGYKQSGSIDSRAVPVGNTVITGFNFDFAGNHIAHRITKIGILKYSPNIYVFFGSSNPNNYYSWLIKWANLR